MKNCRGFISDNPMTSVGIAVAAGFELSRLFSRSYIADLIFLFHLFRPSEG